MIEEKGNQLVHNDACFLYAAKHRKAWCDAFYGGCMVGPLPLLHLDICVRYAAQTGYAFCIAECADFRRELEDEQRKHEGDRVMVQLTIPLDERAMATLKRHADENFRTPELQASLIVEQMLGLRGLTQQDADRLVARNSRMLTTDGETEPDDDFEMPAMPDSLDRVGDGIEKFADGVFNLLGDGFNRLGEEMERIRQDVRRPAPRPEDKSGPDADPRSDTRPRR